MGPSNSQEEAWPGIVALPLWHFNPVYSAVSGQSAGVANSEACVGVLATVVVVFSAATMSMATPPIMYIRG